jgi:hypothetical protein
MAAMSDAQHFLITGGAGFISSLLTSNLFRGFTISFDKIRRALDFAAKMNI